MPLGLSLRRFVDAAIILVLLMTAWRIIGIARPSRDDASRVTALTPAVKVGDILLFPGVVWSASRTVVLVVSSTCPSCADNVPFYRRVAASASPQIQVVAVSDEPESVIREWLRQNGIDLGSVHQVAEPVSHGLTLTPIVLIVNAEGRVTDLMIKRLDNSEQASVLERIRNPTAAAQDNSQQIREISMRDLEAMKSRGRIQVLDVRSRERFYEGHLSNARNIPSRELRARAPIEVESRVPVVVDCLQPGAATPCRPSAWTLIDAGFADVSILMR